MGIPISQSKRPRPILFLRRCTCSTNVPCEARFPRSNGSRMGRHRHELADIATEDPLAGEAKAWGTYWRGFAFSVSG